MVVQSLDKNSLVLSPARLSMEQDPEMAVFRITEHILNATEKQQQKKGVTMTITMERKLASELLTTFFPSTLLMLITFATTFFKPFFFEAALSVNLTTMLVMTTIFISKLEGLPRTSYIKMIDYWLILCQMVPFIEVVLLTAMEYFREEDMEKETQDADKGTSTTIKEEIITVNPNNRQAKINRVSVKAKNNTAPMTILKAIGNFFLINIT